MSTYYLTIDSGNEDEPMPRRFSTLDRAMSAFNGLDDEWKPFAWITYDKTFWSGVPIQAIYMRDGKVVG